MPEDEDAYELGWWIVSALRRRGDLESSLRMRLDRLPDAASQSAVDQRANREYLAARGF